MKIIKHIFTLIFVFLFMTLHSQSKSSTFNAVLESITKDSSNFTVSRKRSDIPKVFFDNMKLDNDLKFRISNSRKKGNLKEYGCLFCSIKRWLVFIATSDNFIILHYVIQKNNMCVNTVICVKEDDKILKKYLLLTGYNSDFTALLNDLNDLTNQKYILRSEKNTYY